MTGESGEKMGFVESYKHLEKLCGEILADDRRIGAYIDEMMNTPRGADLVPGWSDDLRQLKHYRWVRNQIAHEPDCTESNMCQPDDAQWLDHFYWRIMNTTDPLALYAQAAKPRLQRITGQPGRVANLPLRQISSRTGHAENLRRQQEVKNTGQVCPNTDIVLNTNPAPKVPDIYAQTDYRRSVSSKRTGCLAFLIVLLAMAILVTMICIMISVWKS